MERKQASSEPGDHAAGIRLRSFPRCSCTHYIVAHPRKWHLNCNAAVGVMWAIAQSCWFVANATCLHGSRLAAFQMVSPAHREVQLGYSAAFPIILIGPGLIGSLWSVFLFKARGLSPQDELGPWWSRSLGLVRLALHVLCRIFVVKGNLFAHFMFPECCFGAASPE